MVTVSPSYAHVVLLDVAEIHPRFDVPRGYYEYLLAGEQTLQMSPPVSFVTGTDSVQRTVASWSSSLIPSTTTGPVVVRGGFSPRSVPTNGNSGP